MQLGVTEDCILHVIIIEGDEDVSGVHPSNRQSGGSLPCKIDIDRLQPHVSLKADGD